MPADIKHEIERSRNMISGGKKMFDEAQSAQAQDQALDKMQNGI